MKRCILIPSYAEGPITNLITPLPTDLILCADSGLFVAMQAGIVPHAVIGDMDSLEAAGFRQSQLPDGILWVTAPRNKDQTDTALCMEYAIAQGCTEIILLGGLGGRFDHTYANLQNMVGFASKGTQVRLMDQNTIIHILTDNKLTIPKVPGFAVSIFSWTPESTGVTLSGVTYPLRSATLTHDFPLGVSNDITEAYATIEVGQGTLLVICSKIEVSP